MSGEPDASRDISTYLDFATSTCNKGRTTSGGRPCRVCVLVGVRGTTIDFRGGFESKKTGRNGCLRMDEGTGVLEKSDNGR